MADYPRSLAGRIVAAWRDPAGSWRAEWAPAPSEARLVALAFGASLFLTIGPLAAEAIRPAEAFGDERAPWFAARLLIGFSFLPLSLYAVAALLRLVSAACGGAAPGEGGGWKACRLAFFWSALASGPVAAIVHALGAIAGASSFGAAASGAVWLALLAPMLAAAQGFRLMRVALVFAVIAALALLAPVAML